MKKPIFRSLARRFFGKAPKLGMNLMRLETRVCPTVTTSLVAGILTVTGDEGSDIVLITTQGDGDLRVQANNGQLNKIFDGNTVTELRVFLGDGFNDLDIDLTNSNGNDGDHLGFDQNPIIKVTSGADSDTVSVNLGDFGGQGGGGGGDDDGRGDVFLTFDLGGANDRLTITAGGDFGGTFDLDIKVNGGNDYIDCRLDGDLDGAAKVTANLGTGNDTYHFEVCGDIKDEFEYGVIGDTGNDYITATVGGFVSGDSVITADLGAGSDNFSFDIAGDVSGSMEYTVVAGDGNDSVSLDIGGNTDGDFTGSVNMGSSSDYFSLYVGGDVNGAFDLDFVTDSGNDTVTLEFDGDVNGAMSLVGTLGSGNDLLEVTVAGNIVSDDDCFMDFDGGIGLDTAIYTIFADELDDINFSSINFEDVTYADPGAKGGIPPSNPAPTITSVTFGDGTQRSMVKQIVVAFSAPVTFMGTPASAFTLQRSGASNVSLTASPVTGPTSSVTLTFSGTLTEFGSLVDGFYNFIADAAQISGAGGALDGNGDSVAGGSYNVTGTTANKFFRFFGDSDGDGTISQTTDFIAMRNAFGVGANLVFDFNNDGFVGQDDFTQFRNRFGVAL